MVSTSLRPATSSGNPQRGLSHAEAMGTLIESLRESSGYGWADNGPGAIEELLELNESYRRDRWPLEFSNTVHTLRHGDARDLSFIPNESVHLIVTSPPYWTLKEYPPHKHQLGAIEDYETFLVELDKAWKECASVLFSPWWPDLLCGGRRLHFPKKGGTALRDAVACGPNGPNSKLRLGLADTDPLV